MILVSAILASNSYKRTHQIPKQMNLPKKLFLFLFLFCITNSYAQLAKLTPTGEQQYRVNLSKSVVVLTPFSKAIRSTHLSNIIPDGAGGYLKFLVLKGNHGETKAGPYVHFMKLDRKLTIKSETKVSLTSPGSENMEPVSSFESDGRLNLLTAGADNENHMRLTYWQFDLATLTLQKENVMLASLPFDTDKTYEFRSYKVTSGNGFVMTILEEGGRKENSVLHCLTFSESLSLKTKRSTTLPYLGKKGKMIQTLVSNSGTVYCMLGYPDEKKEEIAVNSLLISAGDKSQVLPLTYKDGILINCSIGLSPGNNVLLSGLYWPGKKEYTSALVIQKVAENGKLELMQEEAFSSSLLNLLENADKKGLKKEYYVRSISERDNDIVDVVINNCSQAGGWSGSMFTGGTTYNSAVTISDAVILSFEKGKLAATIPIKRNMEQNSGGLSYNVDAQGFSIPEVVARGNDLYLFYFDNPSNSIGSTDGKKPKWCDFTKGSLVMARIDKNFKPVQQELIQFERGGDFRLFYELTVNKISDNKYILSNDQHGIFTKNVKTASILVEVN